MTKRYWLLKSEPNVFSFDDLANAPKRRTSWEGVRNYQARNFLRNEMKKGDGVLFYHSSTEPQAIMGTAIVVREGYPDPTQFDRRSKYYDEDAPRDAPRWFMVDIELDRAFKRPVTLKDLRVIPGLEDMMLLRKGSRLSVQPVTESEWKVILKLGGALRTPAITAPRL